MADYEIYHTGPDGGKKRVISDFSSLAFTLNTNSIGVVNLSLPGTAYTVTDFAWMDRLRIERDGVLQGNAPYFIVHRQLTLDNSGEYIITLTALHANVLLAGRYTMSYAGSAYSKGSAVAASNLMRRIVRECLGADAAHADRDKAAPLNIITVEADDSAGETVSKSFTRRNVLTVLQEIAEASRQAGTPLYFGIEEIDGVLTFVVRENQWGADRTTTAAISPEFGNLTNASREWDWTEHITVAYALGGGEGVNRLVKNAESAAETTASDYYFVEGIFDNANESNETALQDDANSFLLRRRVITRFSGNVQEATGFLYGTHWGWGDKLKAEFYGEEFSVWLSLVQITASSGRESIQARLEVDE